MPQTPPTGSKVRNVAVLVLVGGVLLGSIELYSALSMGYGGGLLKLGISLAPALACFVASVAIFGLLSGIASLIDKREDAPQEMTYGFRDVVDATKQVKAAIEMLPNILEANRNLSDRQERQSAPPSPASHPANDDKLIHAAHRITALLDEIRELLMMTDAQRQDRLAQHRKNRRVFLVADAQHYVRAKEWGKAERLVEKLELDYPGDATVAEIHHDLTAGRNAAEADSLARAQQKVADLTSIASWDQALAAAADFAEDFPYNPEGQALLAGVQRDRDMATDSSVHHLYEEIKEDIDRRHWRRALAGAQMLLGRFPNHRKSQKILAQLKTLQENAEIQERQEQEARIQELIRAKHFDEALELAEDLVDRFPTSPQADSLDEMLPKLRDLAIHQELA